MSSKGYELVQLAKSLVVDNNGVITDLNIDTSNIEELVNIDLSIAPEILEIQVSAPAAGQDTAWLWTWEQSTLPYARRTITNSPEVQVPLYKQGTYTLNNYAAYDLFGSMTQTHTLYIKWIDGAGTDNLVSWATSTGPVSDTHPDINSGNATDVQRININVPATITIPTLTAPNVTYTVTNNGAGAYTFSGAASGDNPNIGPLYRGGTYTFNVSATGHPFYFTTDNGTNFSAGTYFGEYTDGVTGSRTDSGTVTIVVPSDAPDTLYYQCGNHSPMRGAITVKNLAVETNINGNYVIYAQHTQEGHKTPIELRPIPSLVNQMCLVYDSSTGKFVPQDLATYVENTPSFENKIREVAGTAELVVEDGSAVIAKVNVYDDSTYLPLTGNNAGDQAFATDTDILYIWDGSAWQQAGAANTDDLAEGTTNLFYTDARVSTYLSSNGFDTATNIIASITDTAPATLDTLNELAAALGDDPNFATTTANNIATKLSLSGGAMTGPITTTSTIDGRDIAADGTKLDGIESGADVTDTANVTAAGALMDSEVTNLAQVKAFDSSDYATAAQGTLADNALPLSGGNITGNLDVAGTINAQSAFTTDQVRHSIRPTLNLDFANSKQLDPRITFYRDSIATYYDSKGVLRYSNVNEPRFDHDPVTGESKGLLIEEARTNLNNYTNQMYKWSVATNGNQIVEGNTGVAPDGTYTATKFTTITPTGGNTLQWLFNNVSGSYAGVTVTGSFWARSETPQTLQAHITDNIAGSTYSYNVTTEWQRFTFTKTANAGSNAVGLYPVFLSNTNGIAVYFWGGQLEVGAFATSYIPSDTRFTSRSSAATYHDETGILRTAPANSPRYGYKYDGRKWVETGLILEQGSTNSIQNFFSNAGALQWSNNQNSEPVATSSVTAPDGSTTAFKQEINSTASAIHSIYDYGSVPVGQQLCFSVYAKAAEYDRIFLYTDGIAPTIGGMWYDLSAGTVAAGPNNDVDGYGIENVGDGWYRCWFSGTPTSGATAYFHIDIAQSDNGRTFVGTVGEGVYLWGPQREYSASPSSYIYTDTGNVTRSADVSSSVAYTRAIDVAKINNITNEDWYNTREGSIYTDFYPIGVSDAVVVGVGDGTSRGFRAPWISGDTQLRLGTWSGTAYSALHYYNSITVTSSHKSALSFSYEDNTFISSLDGSIAAVTSSWPGVETDATTIWIGGETDSNRPYNGHIEKVSIYNEALSTAEIQALTENN